MDLADLYYRIQKASADDLAETTRDGSADSLLAARWKALNPLLEQEDVDFMERQPGTQKAAQALEERAKYTTPAGLLGRPDIGAAMQQFGPELTANVLDVGPLIGGVSTAIRGATAGLDNLPAIKRLKDAMAARKMDPALVKAATYKPTKADEVARAADILESDLLARKPRVVEFDAAWGDVSTGNMSKMTPAQKIDALESFKQSVFNPARKQQVQETFEAADKEGIERVVSKYKTDHDKMMRAKNPAPSTLQNTVAGVRKKR